MISSSNDARPTNISQHMIQKTKTYIDKILYQQKNNIDNLLTSTYTMLDGELSAYYGYNNVQNTN